jgi:hypothetical protein
MTKAVAANGLRQGEGMLETHALWEVSSNAILAISARLRSVAAGKPEIPGIGAFARAEAEGVLERRQGAHPAAELDEHAPGRGWDMRPYHAAPAEGEQRAQRHKQRKRSVQRDDEVGHNAEDVHRDPSIHLRLLAARHRLPHGCNDIRHDDRPFEMTEAEAIELLTRHRSQG